MPFYLLFPVELRPRPSALLLCWPCWTSSVHIAPHALNKVTLVNRIPSHTPRSGTGTGTGLVRGACVRARAWTCRSAMGSSYLRYSQTSADCRRERQRPQRSRNNRQQATPALPRPAKAHHNVCLTREQETPGAGGVLPRERPLTLLWVEVALLVALLPFWRGWCE
jgi:hypothetical protein